MRSEALDRRQNFARRQPAFCLSRLSPERAEAVPAYTEDNEDAVNIAAYMVREETPKKKQAIEFLVMVVPRATCPNPRGSRVTECRTLSKCSRLWGAALNL